MSASGDWGLAPPGIDLKETQAAEIPSPVIALMGLGVMAVSGRLMTRLKAGAHIAVDDYLVIASLVFAMGTARLCIARLRYGNSYALHHEHPIWRRQASLGADFLSVHNAVDDDVCVRANLRNLCELHKDLHPSLLPTRLWH